MTIEKYIKQEKDLLENDLTKFLEGAVDCLSMKNFDKLIQMLRDANIDNVELALDPILVDSIKFYVRYIFDNEGKLQLPIDEFVEKVLMPLKTHLSKTHEELVNWIENNADKIGVKIHLTDTDTFISR